MAQPHPPMTERELPMLAGIAAFFRWCEELLNILNGPLLMFGAGIALVDLLTDGALTATDKALLFAWAISQALGIDLQLLACFARARMAMLRHHYWALFGWILLGIPLAVATWQAGYVYALQQSEHISEAAALAEAGMDRRTWLAWRVALAVLLVCLAGWTRYVAPRINAEQSAAEERAKLEREIELEPLRQKLRAQQLRGARGLAADARGVFVAAVTGREKATSADPLPMTQEPPAASAETDPSEPSDDEPPDGSDPTAARRTRKGAPAQATRALVGASYDTSAGEYSGNGRKPVNFRRSVAARRARKRIVGDGLTVRQRAQRDAAYAILDADPTTSQRRLATKLRERGLGCGPKQAKRYKEMWASRNAQREAAAATK